MLRKLEVEQLEDRLVPAGTFIWNSPGQIGDSDSWSTARNWWDPVAGAAWTRAPGMGAGNTDDTVQITSARGRPNCILDRILDNPIGSLKLSDANETLSLQANLNIIGSDNVISLIESGATLTSSVPPGTNVRLRVGGGVTKITSGAIIGKFNNTGGSRAGSIYINGGALQFDDKTGDSAAVDLHWSIKVADGGTLNFNNGLTPVNAGVDPSSSVGTVIHYARVVCDANGRVNVNVGNTTGFNPTPTAGTTASLDNNTNAGIWTIANTSAFYFGEPIFQTGGSFTIRQGATIQLDGKTGTRGVAGGTQEHSFYMNGGTLELQGDGNPLDACGILDVNYGLMMDDGTIWCSATPIFGGQTGYIWEIISHGVGAEFQINGGTVEIGSNISGWNATGFLFYTGPDVNSEAVSWLQGKMEFNWDSAGNYSGFRTNTKMRIGLPTVPPNPANFAWLTSDAPPGVYANLIMSNGINSHPQDPCAGEIWFSDWTATTWGIHR